MVGCQSVQTNQSRGLNAGVINIAMESISCLGFSVSAQDFNIGIKHGSSCINIRQVPWEVLKTEAEGA